MCSCLRGMLTRRSNSSVEPRFPQGWLYRLRSWGFTVAEPENACYFMDYSWALPDGPSSSPSSSLTSALAVQMLQQAVRIGAAALCCSLLRCVTPRLLATALPELGGSCCIQGLSSLVRSHNATVIAFESVVLTAADESLPQALTRLFRAIASAPAALYNGASLDDGTRDTSSVEVAAAAAQALHVELSKRMVSDVCAGLNAHSLRSMRVCVCAFPSSSNTSLLASHVQHLVVDQQKAAADESTYPKRLV